MSYEIPGFNRSYSTAGDLSASWYKFVKLAGATVVAVTGPTDDAIGVLQNKPAKAGAAATVQTTAVSRVFSGKALAAGVAVYLDATGAVTDVLSAGNCVGVTESAVTAAGLLVSVLLKPLGAVGA